MPRPRRRSPPLRHYRPKLRLDDRIGRLRTAQLFGAHSVTGDDAGLAAGLLAAGRSNRLVIVFQRLPANRRNGRQRQRIRECANVQKCNAQNDRHITPGGNDQRVLNPTASEAAPLGGRRLLG